MRRVIVESPFHGGFLRRWLNVRFARACLRDCLMRGEAPIASHVLLNGVLRDDVPEERQLGIDAGHAWIGSADAMVVYMPGGTGGTPGVVTPGMNLGIRKARAIGIPIEFRRLETKDGA